MGIYVLFGRIENDSSRPAPVLKSTMAPPPAEPSTPPRNKISAPVDACHKQQGMREICHCAPVLKKMLNVPSSL